MKAPLSGRALVGPSGPPDPTRATRDHEALVRFLDGRMRTPFAWGDSANDCVSFADAGVVAQGLDSVIARLGVSWSTARGASRVLNRLGGLEAAVDAVLASVPSGRAMRGDVGLVAGLGPYRQSLVLIEGQSLVGPGLSGLERLPRRALLKAWSVA